MDIKKAEAEAIATDIANDLFGFPGDNPSYPEVRKALIDAIKAAYEMGYEDAQTEAAEDAAGADI